MRSDLHFTVLHCSKGTF